RRTRRVLTQDLVGETADAVLQLVDETQHAGLQHLVLRRAIGGPRFLCQFMREQRQETGLVHGKQVAEVVDLGLQVHQAGKKSMGLVVVMVSTSLASKRNSFTRATSLRSRSSSFSSLDTMRHWVTSPDGAMVISSTTLPCRVGVLRR